MRASMRLAAGATAAADFPTLQRSLCAQALSLARPDGGRVVTTCSLEREQNDDVADAVEAAVGMGNGPLRHRRRAPSGRRTRRAVAAPAWVRRLLRGEGGAGT